MCGEPCAPGGQRHVGWLTIIRRPVAQLLAPCAATFDFSPPRSLLYDLGVVEQHNDRGASTKTFADDVYAVVRRVPLGRVTTYGTIGQLLGRYRSARLVGWAMRHCPPGLPAHRVVNASGVLSGGWAFGHPSVQRSLLEAEGVRFIGEVRCDLDRHYWPTAVEAEALTPNCTLPASENEP